MINQEKEQITEGTLEQTSEQFSQKNISIPEIPIQAILCPYKLITGHWLTLSRPQYKRTCGISSLISIWNYQFSKLGMGDKDPISIEQAMLKLNLIGNGSIEQAFRKKFKKKTQLSERGEGVQEEEIQDLQIANYDKGLGEYIDSVDFGVFTGNQALMKWYRILCRIYGGSGRSYMFYKTNSTSSQHKTQQTAKKGLVEGLNSNGKICFIYHAYDHYFCPVGYEFIPSGQENDSGVFQSPSVNQENSELYVMVGQSSKMFPCMHIFKWSQINLDINTYWPQYYNIRRRTDGVQTYKGKQNAIPRKDTINCIMAFEKIKD